MARPRSDIRRRVVDAARQRFLAEGVDGASLRSIAQDAGSNLGMIVYYFPTKDDLFLAVVDEVYGRLLDGFEMALAPGPDVRERLRFLFHNMGQLTPEELQVVQLVLREALVSSARLERLVQRFMRGHVPAVLKVVSDGIRDGTFAGQRHPLVLMMVILALAGPPQVIARGFLPPSPLPIADLPTGKALSDELLDILMNGIAGPSGADEGERGRRRKRDRRENR